jgi:soluble lytic murein transglycosylase-like protein
VKIVLTKRQLFASLALLVAAPASFATARKDGALYIPPGYALVANEFRIPAALLYGVALQESVMQFGEPRARRHLPWPWTLNIAGTPARFATRAAAEQRLHSALRTGVDSVDIGPMGVNWRYHKNRLISVERSLDPYWNLRVGAGLLADHFADCNSWPEAIGRYHSPGNKVRAASYSASVFTRLRRLGHA